MLAHSERSLLRWRTLVARTSKWPPQTLNRAPAPSQNASEPGGVETTECFLGCGGWVNAWPFVQAGSRQQERDIHTDTVASRSLSLFQTAGCTEGCTGGGTALQRSVGALSRCLESGKKWKCGLFVASWFVPRFQALMVCRPLLGHRQLGQAAHTHTMHRPIKKRERIARGQTF